MKSFSVSDKQKRRIAFAIVIFICLFSLIPLFGKELYWGHDSGFHTQRILSIANGFANGDFPVRIYKEIYNGYGYGAPLYYCDIFLYVPALLLCWGVPLSVCFKIFIVFVNLVTALISLWSFTKISDSYDTGLIAAILYYLSTYRLVDVYTRAAAGEMLAMAFAPLALCGLVMIERGELKYWKALSLGFVGLICSHMLSCLLMILFCVLYVIVSAKNFANIKKVLFGILAAVCSIATASWFVFPFLQSQSLPVGSSTGTIDNFYMTTLTLSDYFDFLSRGAAYGENLHGTVSEFCMTKTPGPLLIIGSIIAVVALASKAVKENRAFILKMLLLGAFCMLLTSDLFPWKMLQDAHFMNNRFTVIQFAWRLNILVVLLLALPAADGFATLLDKLHSNGYAGVAIVTAASLLIAGSYFYNLEKHQDRFIDGEYNQYMTMDIMYLFDGFSMDHRVPVESNCDFITYDKYNPGNSEIELGFVFLDDNSGGYYIDVPINYYHGYVSEIDGIKVDNTYSEGGVVRVMIPEGIQNGTLSVYYDESATYIAADIVSALMIVVWIGLFLGVKKKWKQNQLTASKNSV